MVIIIIRIRIRIRIIRRRRRRRRRIIIIRRIVPLVLMGIRVKVWFYRVIHYV